MMAVSGRLPRSDVPGCRRSASCAAVRTRWFGLERELVLFGTQEPFTAIDQIERAKPIHRPSLIVPFAGEAAKKRLPRLLDATEGIDKALDFVMRVADPVDIMHPAAVALYRPRGHA